MFLTLKEICSKTSSCCTVLTHRHACIHIYVYICLEVQPRSRWLSTFSSQCRLRSLEPKRSSCHHVIGVFAGLFVYLHESCLLKQSPSFAVNMWYSSFHSVIEDFEKTTHRCHVETGKTLAKTSWVGGIVDCCRFGHVFFLHVLFIR